MHALCESSLLVMKEAGATFDALADFDDIAELNRLADGVTNADAAKFWAACLVPEVRVGRMTFRRLTIQREAWIDQVQEWFDESTFPFLLGFALSSSEKQLSGAWTRGGARRAVFLWRCRARLPVRSLLRIVSQLRVAEDAADKVEKDVDESPDHGWLIELLCKEYGREPGYWVRECPSTDLIMLARNAQVRIEKENRLNSGQSDAASEYIAKLRKYRDAEAAFRKKKLGDL